MTPKILYKFATRSRPVKFINCLENIKSLSTHENYEIIVSADLDDLSMNNDRMKDITSRYKNVQLIFGTSESKVAAINRDISIKTEFDILINMSDDMWFMRPGFDSIIVKDFQTYWPDFDGLLHYHDGGSYGAKLMTMSILGKKYYDRFGYIYFPSYKNVYCDNEAKDVAQILGKYKWIPDILFNHNHPMWGKAQWDAQYRNTEDPAGYAVDKNTYNIRKSHDFYLTQ